MRRKFRSKVRANKKLRNVITCINAEDRRVILFSFSISLSLFLRGTHMSCKPLGSGNQWGGVAALEARVRTLNDSI
jgi:hypothetical protein